MRFFETNSFHLFFKTEEAFLSPFLKHPTLAVKEPVATCSFPHFAFSYNKHRGWYLLLQICLPVDSK